MRVHADPDPELLLAHSAWIRTLARRLAGEEADDLVQDTWLAALGGPRAEVRSVRGWLAGILTNLARETRRGDGRRRARERSSAREPSRASVADTFEAVTTGRELADTVLELEEPFRAVVLLRYYEDLPPRHIAKRLGIPVRTVNSRLARGLERLRERWKQHHGGRDGTAWVRSLLFLAGSRSLSPSAAAATVSGAALPLGVALMNSKIWLGVALVGTGTMAWWLSASRGSETRSAEPPPASRAETAALEPFHAETPIAPSAPGAEGRAAVPLPAVSAPEKSAESSTPATWTVRGRVLDSDALPRAGVEVEYRGNGVPEDAPLVVTSGTGGRFELPVPSGGGELWAHDPSLVTVARGRVNERSGVEPLVIVAPRIELAGHVVDAAGAPLSEVRLRFENPSGFGARFEAVFDTTEMSGWKTESDEGGAFELAPVPSITGAHLVAELEGYEPIRIEVPWKSDRELVLTLPRRVAEDAAVTGRVVDAENRPVAGAWVSLGQRSTASDSAGEFRLERGEAKEALELRALKSGYRPASFRASTDGAGAPVFPPYVQLVLGPPPLALAVHVVDGKGEPRGGMRAWLADPTPFGILDDDMLGHVEYYLGASEDETPEDVAYWCARDTDGEGRARFTGLLERDYSVRVMNPRTLEIRTFGPFHAGDASAEIVFEDGELGRIAARVVTRDGRALSGIPVRLLGNTFGGIWSESANMFSDEQGRVLFEEVGGEQMMLSVGGEDVMPLWSGAHLVRGGEFSTELVVSVRCTIQVDLGLAAERADALWVLDAEGARLDLYRIGPTGSFVNNQFPIVAGRSESLGVSDAARTLVLLKGGTEVERVPLDLRPGTLNLVTP